MLLKEIGRKIAQAFRSARAADEKVASSIAAALDAKAEQIKEYEKRFEPEPPEPDLPQEINAASPFTFEFYLAGIPIAQAMAAAARCSSDEMALNGTTWTAHVQPWTNTRSRRRRRENNGRS